RDKESAIIIGHRTKVQQALEEITSRLGSEYVAAQHAHEAQKTAQAKTAQAKPESAEETRTAAFPVIPPGAPQGLVDTLTSGGKPKRRRKKNRGVTGEDESPSTLKSTTAPQEQSHAPEQVAPVSEPPAPVSEPPA